MQKWGQILYINVYFLPVNVVRAGLCLFSNYCNVVTLLEDQKRCSSDKQALDDYFIFSLWGNILSTVSTVDLISCEGSAQ
jgi:hypothetical protein